MKKIFILGLMVSTSLMAQITTGLPGSSTTGTSTPNTGIPASATPSTTLPTSPTTPAQKAPQKEEGPLIKVPAKVSASNQINYLSPGVIANRVTGWAGSDNLLNVSSHIPVRVELVLPLGKKPPFAEADIKKRVTDIFSKAGIVDTIQAYNDKPPLPFFHVLVMVQPIDKGFAVYMAGRLFEQVDNPRIVLNDEGFFQAITWEKQDMVIASPEDIANQVNSIIDEIAQNFADRYTFFEALKKDMK